MSPARRSDNALAVREEDTATAALIERVVKVVVLGGDRLEKVRLTLIWVMDSFFFFWVGGGERILDHNMFFNESWIALSSGRVTMKSLLYLFVFGENCPLLWKPARTMHLERKAGSNGEAVEYFFSLPSRMLVCGQEGRRKFIDIKKKYIYI